MKTCALCGKQIALDKYFSRKSICPHCGGDLHICLNCTFYSEKSHNKCREPKAEYQRVRDKANFCDFFTFGESQVASEDATNADARKALENLFRKGTPSSMT